MTAILLTEQAAGVLRLTLNRPQARNALSIELMTALVEALGRAAEDPHSRVVVIAGAGSAFCAGHDLRELRQDPRRETYQRIFALCSELMLAIVRLPKPVIAEVHGVATAAGCQLVATCDLASAAEEARFATPGVNIGLFCSTPMAALSRAVGRKAAMEMLLTGAPVGAATAPWREPASRAAEPRRDGLSAAARLRGDPGQPQRGRRHYQRRDRLRGACRCARADRHGGGVPPDRNGRRHRRSGDRRRRQGGVDAAR